MATETNETTSCDQDGCSVRGYGSLEKDPLAELKAASFQHRKTKRIPLMGSDWEYTIVHIGLSLSPVELAQIPQFMVLSKAFYTVFYAHIPRNFTMIMAKSPEELDRLSTALVRRLEGCPIILYDPPKLTSPLVAVTHLTWIGPPATLDVSFFPNLEVLVISDTLSRKEHRSSDRGKAPPQLIDLHGHARLRVLDIDVFREARFYYEQPLAIRILDTLETFVCPGVPVFYTDDDTQPANHMPLPSHLTACAVSRLSCWKIFPVEGPALGQLEVGFASTTGKVYNITYTSYSFPTTLKHLVVDENFYRELPASLETLVSLFPGAQLHAEQQALPHLQVLCTRDAAQLEQFKRVLRGSNYVHEKLITEADKHSPLVKLLDFEYAPKREWSACKRQQCHENYLFCNKRVFVCAPDRALVNGSGVY